jgi:tetraacyldisaccharide 4'-kinase
MEELMASCSGWEPFEETGWKGIRKGACSIRFFFGPLPSVTGDALLLMGLGGTANQVCAGMGVPVVSIEEKGKFVQKKLLGGSELLVPPTAQSLAEGAARILSDGSLRLKMAREGKERLGGPGALDTVVAHAAESMGWDLRCRLFQRLSERWSGL